MPTGYTAMIEEDGNTNAREFVRKCAREFMPFIHQRDVDPLSVPPRLPDEEWAGESEWRRKSRLEAEAHLTDAKGWTQEQARNKYAEYMQTTFDDNNRRIEEFNELDRRYQAVLDKLAKWEPQEEAARLKEFAIEQIEMSKPHSPYIVGIATFDVWWAEEINAAQRSVDYYDEQLVKDRERHEGNRRMAQIFLDEIERVPE